MAPFTEELLLKQLNECVVKGVKFLAKNQLPYGEFKTYVSLDPKMQDQCRYISTTYITTFVMYSLSFIEQPIVSSMLQKALTFLTEEIEFNGVWRFFTANRNIKFFERNLIKYTEIGIVPDLDDTACCSYCLKVNNIDFGSNLDYFLNNRDERGLFYTWLMNLPKRKEYTADTPYMIPRTNDICCGVHSNILLYLGENSNTLNSCEYINSVVLEGNLESNLIHFTNRLIFYYLMSRAYYSGVYSLEKSKNTVLNDLLSVQQEIAVQQGVAALQEDGSFGSVLSTACAVCTCLNFNYVSTQIHDILRKSVNYIIQFQREDGSWQKEQLCYGDIRYYGSEELTTAICLEALARYERWCKNETDTLL